MDKLFLDTNAVVDLLDEREPFHNTAARIAPLADKRKIQLIVSASTYSTIHYLLSRFADALQYYCALKMDCNILIIRNVKDFKD